MSWSMSVSSGMVLSCPSSECKKLRVNLDTDFHKQSAPVFNDFDELLR